MQILYATDGSEGALAGAQLLRGLPVGAGSRIRILTVAPHEAESKGGEEILIAARHALCGSEAEVVAEVRRGDSAGEVLEEILRAAEEKPTDLVVVGTRGRSALIRFFLGSVAARVARYTPCPVLLARPLRSGTLDRVLVGVDGSTCSEQAVAWLRRFPLPPDCQLRLVTAVAPASAVYRRFMLPVSVTDHLHALVRQERKEAGERLEALAADLAASGFCVTVDVRSDDPVSGLITAAEQQDADLVVLGAQGRGGMDRFLLGSVSEKVLRHAPCSVLVVRPCLEEASDRDESGRAGGQTG